MKSLLPIFFGFIFAYLIILSSLSLLNAHKKGDINLKSPFATYKSSDFNKNLTSVISTRDLSKTTAIPTKFEDAHTNVLGSQNSQTLTTNLLNLQNQLEQSTGAYSFVVKKLPKNTNLSQDSQGYNFQYNPEVVVYGASLYKIPIAITVLNKVQNSALTLDTEIVLDIYDISDGSGTIKSYQVGTKFTIEQLLNYLLKQSDNTAQNMLLKVVSYNDINALFKNDLEVQQILANGNTKASDYVILLENLINGKYINMAYTKYLVELMSQTSFDNRISTGVNATNSLSNVSTSEDTQKKLKFSHKIGNWPATSTWHDCGILYEDINNLSESTIVCLVSQNVIYEEFLQNSASLGKVISQ